MRTSRRQRAPDIEEAIEDIVEDLPKILPGKVAAMTLGISVRTLQRWIEYGTIAPFRTTPGRGGKVLIARAEIVRVLRTMAS